MNISGIKEDLVKSLIKYNLPIKDITITEDEDYAHLGMIIITFTDNYMNLCFNKYTYNIDDIINILISLYPEYFINKKRYEILTNFNIQ